MGWGHTDLGGVVGSTENQLRSAVVTRADVGNVGLVGDEDLSAAKVAELEDAGARVKKEILGLDITVTDALGVNVGERAEQLVCVQLHLEEWHGGLELIEVPRSTVDGLWDVFQYQVQVDLVLLLKSRQVSDIQHRRRRQQHISHFHSPTFNLPLHQTEKHHALTTLGTKKKDLLYHRWSSKTP